MACRSSRLRSRGARRGPPPPGGTSKEQGAKAARLPQFATAITVASGGRYTPQAGGIPVRRDGSVIGAAGASGLASGEVDQEILQQAVADALAAG